MDPKLQEIIQKSTFTVKEGRYIYAKVKEVPTASNYFMIAKDEDEITVVTKEEDLESIDLVEKNKECYRLIALHVSVPFYAVGFLATVTKAIADQGMNILVISTYSKDYVLVREDKLDQAKRALIKLGFQKA